jgi:hypothetical protein
MGPTNDKLGQRGERGRNSYADGTYRGPSARKAGRSVVWSSPHSSHRCGPRCPYDFVGIVLGTSRVQSGTPTCFVSPVTYWRRIRNDRGIFSCGSAPISRRAA